MGIIEPLNGTGAPHYRKSCRAPSAYVYAVCLGIAKCRCISLLCRLLSQAVGTTERPTMYPCKTISHFHTRPFLYATCGCFVHENTGDRTTHMYVTDCVLWVLVGSHSMLTFYIQDVHRSVMPKQLSNIRSYIGIFY